MIIASLTTFIEKAFENTMGKAENAGWQHFALLAMFFGLMFLTDSRSEESQVIFSATMFSILLHNKNGIPATITTSSAICCRFLG